MVIAKAKPGEMLVKHIDEVDPRLDSAVTIYDDKVTSVEWRETASLPSGAYYFPLDGATRGYHNGDEIDGVITTPPSALLFDENGAWSGTSTTNLWPAIEQGWKGAAAIDQQVSVHPNKSKQYAIAVTSSASKDTLSASNVLSVAANDYVTISAYYRSDSNITPQKFIMSTNTTGSAAAAKASETVEHLPTAQKSFQRGFKTQQITAAGTMYPWISYYGDTTATAVIAALMINKKPYVEPWCEASRASTRLQFNLHAGIGLNWNEPWTIVYWKKPHGTDGNTLVGYSIDSVGRNNNSVGGGYRWWGKQPGSTNYGFTGSGTTINWVDYQYGWHMHSLSYDGSKLYLRVYGNVGKRIGGVHGLWLDQFMSQSIPAANYYVTQNNYDLMLGGYDNSSESNVYYRDVIVVKRALATEEVDLLYNRRIRMFADGIEVNNLIEGVI